MNTKAYFELSNANAVGRTPATVFERLKWWISISKLVHEGKTYCFRTYEQLAEEIGVSLSTARRAIAFLVGLGWLEKVKLKAKQWNQTNCYTLGENAPEVKTQKAQESKQKTGESDWTTRSVHSDAIDSSKMTPSINKKSCIPRKIKETQAKALSIAKRLTNSPFRGSHCNSFCGACNGSGIVSDEFNNGYRCLCADGRSKSALIPQVPEKLFLSLRGQISAHTSEY
ncbi:MAG: helix-turn-helix domain-containing protein [Cyanobacteria bacterium P01_E01_bin.34]